jgi:8-hydroxy-5-deazaflavin:NADPH oxidoreductase
MNIGIFGTGIVGDTIGTKLIELGHHVKMGSRSPDNPKAAEWVQKNGSRASTGVFADAAVFGQMLFNCTHGAKSLDALSLAGKDNLDGKILIDPSNPLDFSKGMPPSLTVCNTDSLGEQIQRTFPDVKVVKTLNTVNCKVMVNPALVPGDHDLLMCGNDENAKKQVMAIVKEWFGWKSVIDLGGITASRVTEMYLPLWATLFGVFQTPIFNLRIQK